VKDFGILLTKKKFKISVCTNLIEMRRSRGTKYSTSIKAAARLGSAVGGRGAYSTNKNSLISSSKKRSAMSGRVSDNSEDMLITHTEYMYDIYAPSDGTVTNVALPLNPGLSAQFTYLAQFAQNYAEYEFVQLIFQFRSTIDASATNNTSGNTGTIIMGCNYDANEPAYTTKDEMLQAHGSVSGRVTENMVCGIECDPRLNAGAAQRYTRAYNIYGQDKKTLDWGTFQYAMVNIPSAFANQQVGELWVYYKVRLSKPRLWSGLMGNQGIYRITGDKGVQASSKFGTNPLYSESNNIDITYTEPASNQIKVKFAPNCVGIFDIIMCFEGTDFIQANVAPTLVGEVKRFINIFCLNEPGPTGKILNLL